MKICNCTECFPHENIALYGVCVPRPLNLGPRLVGPRPQKYYKKQFMNKKTVGPRS